MAETAETNSQYPTSYSTLIQHINPTATVWPLKTTSGLNDTGSDVIRPQLTSKKTLTLCRHDILHYSLVIATQLVHRLQIHLTVHNWRAPYHSPSCIRVRAVMWECGDCEGQTDTQAAVASIHFASAMPHVKCNK